MKSLLRVQPVLIALTLVNCGILSALWLRGEPVAAAAAGDGMLRGRGLQIVDSDGKVRASISISSAARQPDGSTYPETVLLRLITSEGRPVVKLASAEDGASLALSSARGAGFVQLLARGDEPQLAVFDQAGTESAKLPR